MTIRIFDLDTSTHMVDLNKVHISTIKEFKTLLKRDKSREKTKALKEFTFIYHLCDFRSQFITYNEKERLQKALKNAELPEDTNVEKDEELLAAIEVYKILQYTPALGYLDELMQGLHTAKKVINKIRRDLETRLDEIDATQMEEQDEKGKKKAYDPLIIIAQRLDKIMEYANKLPATLNSIEGLYDKVKKQLADVPELRGGAEKGANEDPKDEETYRPNPMISW